MGLGCTNQCFNSNIVCLNGRKYYINPSYPVYVAANNCGGNCGGNCVCCGQNNGNFDLFALLLLGFPFFF